jgi:hypothetical protein
LHVVAARKAAWLTGFAIDAYEYLVGIPPKPVTPLVFETTTTNGVAGPELLPRIDPDGWGGKVGEGDAGRRTV